MLPREAVPCFPVLRDMLRRCSELSAAGQLLVPPSLPEIQAVRRWVCDEVGRQTQDLPPRPWTDIVIEDVPVDPMSADAIDTVRASSLAQIAADRWNRIIAVSPRNSMSSRVPRTVVVVTLIACAASVCWMRSGSWPSTVKVTMPHCSVPISRTTTPGIADNCARIAVANAWMRSHVAAMSQSSA